MSEVVQALRAFGLTARHRWWIAPLIIGLTTMFMWAQESDLRTEPSYYAVVKTVEVTDQLDSLLAVGIQPQSVVSQPSEKAQLGMLQSTEVAARLETQVGGSAPVTVTQAERQVQFLSAIVESGGQDAFTFRFNPANIFSFSCTEETRGYCEPLIDAYISELVSMRTEAIQTGLENLETVLRTALVQLPKDSANVDLLSLQAETLSAAQKLNLVEPAVISTSVVEEGATVTTVQRGSYSFGVLIGVILILLVWSQMAFTDQRIHNHRRISQRLSNVRYLGNTDGGDVSQRHLAASIGYQANQLAVRDVRLVPLTNAGNEKLQRDLQSKLPSLTISTTQSVTTMDVEQLISSAATADVLVVQRHADRLDTVENAVRVLQNSGRRLLGFVIVSR
jgi:hypothetical protein